MDGDFSDISMDNLVKHQGTIDFPMKIMGVSSHFSLKPVQ
jgi:hypothetical protein